ncbi:MAG TPA: hypothetical protein EYG82_03455 [Sulfurovum sp.]|nr:hypothetical protein [Sulfurovum sp.]
MNNKTKYIILFFATVLLFLMNNCNEEKKEETYRTIAYFSQHTDIRDKRVSECKTLKDMTEISAKDCANANFSARSGKPVDTSNW